MTSWFDRCIIEFDLALRSVVGGSVAQRPNPANLSSGAAVLPQLDQQERNHAAG